MRCLEPSIAEEQCRFLPHHCVFKTVEQTSKIRIIFDASCRSSSGRSLNVLLVGPTVQQDLISILIPSFHLSSPLTSKNVSADFSASVSDAQRILWRDDLSANVDTYELTTVSYDTAFAFLATRCLKHLAEQHAHQFTRGSACVLRDFYVDDLLTGADDTVDELKLIRDETNY